LSIAGAAAPYAPEGKEEKMSRQTAQPTQEKKQQIKAIYLTPALIYYNHFITTQYKTFFRYLTSKIPYTCLI